jgi:hypothetical protein
LLNKAKHLGLAQFLGKYERPIEQDNYSWTSISYRGFRSYAREINTRKDFRETLTPLQPVPILIRYQLPPLPLSNVLRETDLGALSMTSLPFTASRTSSPWRHSWNLPHLPSYAPYAPKSFEFQVLHIWTTEVKSK